MWFRQVRQHTKLLGVNTPTRTTHNFDSMIPASCLLNSNEHTLCGYSPVLLTVDILTEYILLE